ncbi:NUDIX hydrolase [Patescibacteria group bacterium]|nr:NUDIX hydrolase [Patescibacteria group bacterium]MBU1952270.1 NUDIX hydrolase [Patescibacteria group bacterium]
MKNPIVVSGAVIVEGNKALLNQHGDTDFWKFCGGKVEDIDKTLIETAKREAMEELGIEIEIEDPEPFIAYDKTEIKDGVFDVKLIHYFAKRLNDIKPGSDIRKWGWFDVNDLPKNVAPNVILALKHFKFLKKNPYTTEVM